MKKKTYLSLACKLFGKLGMYIYTIILLMNTFYIFFTRYNYKMTHDKGTMYCM